jgi:cell division protein ZapA
VGHVAVTLNRRTYRLECEDGQEPRLLGLAAHLRSKLDALTAQFGQVGDDRLMLLAALQIADELWEAREQMAAMAAAAADASAAPEQLPAAPAPAAVSVPTAAAPRRAAK